MLRRSGPAGSDSKTAMNPNDPTTDDPIGTDTVAIATGETREYHADSAAGFARGWLARGDVPGGER